MASYAIVDVENPALAVEGWRDLAACRDRPAAVMAAPSNAVKRLCSSCVVAEVCLWSALDEEWGLESACRWGVRGAVSAPGRVRFEDSLRRRWGAEVRVVALACLEGELAHLGFVHNECRSTSSEAPLRRGRVAP